MVQKPGGEQRKDNRRGGAGGGRDRGGRTQRPKKERPEFDQSIIDLSRVTRVTKGGKQMSFRACVVIGDRKGRVGFGLDKGKDVQLAVEKAVNQAKKHMLRIPMVRETIPHMVSAKLDAGKILLMPAPRGSGLIAGSVVRTIMELAGVPNISAKLLSKTKNKVTNVKVTFAALEHFQAARKEVVNDVDVAMPKVAEDETAETPSEKKPARKPSRAKAV